MLQATKKLLEERRGSTWAEAGASGIHQNGLFASRDIPEDTRIIEYIGDKITKAESERRANLQDEEGRSSGDGVVYIFTLNDRYDIDGNVDDNHARFANHSCDPNAYTDIIDGRVWLRAAREIEKGEEIVYDYGFDLSCWEDHPCLCGAKRCLGYIVGEEFRPEMKRKLKAKKAERKGRRPAARK